MFCLLLLGAVFTSLPAHAEFDFECYIKNDCRRSWGGSSSNPSAGGQVRINPAAVPTEKGFGIEGIYFKEEIDLALARGQGRVGAAISPSNSEETFFGPPGFEDADDYLERHIEAKKYPSQKVTLAAAAKLVDKKGGGLKQFNLSIGAMGKYNKLTTNVSPGAGLSGNLGPLSFGGSYYLDETQLNGELPENLRPDPILYNVQTYNVGFFLSSLILDYSHMKLQQEELVSEVTVVTASLLLNGFIFTAAKRSEKSQRPKYDPITKELEYVLVKEDIFGGLQYSFTRNFMLGILYNYYLLHEASLSATVFF